MMLGLVLTGCFIGSVGAVTALCLGKSVWVALLIYSGAGILSVLTIGVIVVLSTSLSGRTYSGSRDLPWRITSVFGKPCPGI